MERYVCSKLDCIPKEKRRAVQHNHFDVVMNHFDKNGELIGNVERHFVNFAREDDLLRGAVPVRLVNSALEKYGILSKPEPGAVNTEEVSAANPPQWGTATVDDRRK